MFFWKRTELGKDFRTSHLYEIKNILYIAYNLYKLSIPKTNIIFRNLLQYISVTEDYYSAKAVGRIEQLEIGRGGHFVEIPYSISYWTNYIVLTIVRQLSELLESIGQKKGKFLLFSSGLFRRFDNFLGNFRENS